MDARAVLEKARVQAKTLYEQRLASLKPQHQAKVREVLSWPYWMANLGSDAHRYIVAHERGVPIPYHYRWLMPYLCKGDRRKFTAVTYGSLLGMVPAMRLYSGEWVSGLYMFGLGGVWKINRVCPYLADPPAMLLAILSAAAVQRGRWGLSIALSLAGGATKESAPVFAALYAWNPIPLVGLLAPAVRHLQPPGDDIVDDYSHYVLEHPFETAYDTRVGQSRNFQQWIYPWGALLLGLKPNVQTAATLSAAYGQCLRAVDNSRLYEWAWPVLARNTVEVTGNLAGPALLAHWMNPWKGDGG